ncbi:MAG: PEP-CTERM sorting domain-containing protein [Planctomycetes bacterium]|nr:PEP-CTERM sorting domain-containing protein [Planctomycetota bacterium]
MTFTIRTISIALLALMSIPSLCAQAAVLQINGIAPFDTNLGVLTQAVVTLDPIPQQTGNYQTIFPSISSHLHTVNTPPVLVPGFDNFVFAPVQTSIESSPSLGTHSHSFNLFPSFKIYTGAGLAWFLNPANTPINSVPVPAFQTNLGEGHVHLINLSPIVPRTAFTYNPIPEPATLSLLSLGGIALMLRRKRIA